MGKRSKSTPVVARRPDGTIYSSERVRLTVNRCPTGEIVEHKDLPTRKAHDLLVKLGIVKP